MLVRATRVGIVCLCVTVSPSFAATHSDISGTSLIKKEEGTFGSATLKRDNNTLVWQVESENLPSFWETWEYDWDLPQFLSAQTESTYYGFGVWQPESLQEQSHDQDVEEWILDQGVNFSFSAESKATNTRYRFDMRWHEKTDTEFLFQLQVPLR